MAIPSKGQVIGKLAFSMMNKEQRQVASLGGVLITIIGTLLYVYRGAILPSVGPIVDSGAPTRIVIPTNDDKDPFFDREDYRALRGTPGVPVVPVPVKSQGIDPFATPKKSL